MNSTSDFSNASFNKEVESDNGESYIGIGLRHQHYREALLNSAALDFVEVHSENFFAAGGLSLELLSDVRDKYPLSLHCTSLGLGAAVMAPEMTVSRLRSLVDRYEPCLVSDHASFCWTKDEQGIVFAGDLLPITHNASGLRIFSDNVNRIQQALGRQLLIENLSHYDTADNHIDEELDFLQRVSANTGSGLLLDLNNLYVSAVNLSIHDPVSVLVESLKSVDSSLIGEIHLAGCAPVAPGEIMVDDHSQLVSESVWALYQETLALFGNKPTLIEWDEQIPEWDVLLGQSAVARLYAESLNELESA